MGPARALVKSRADEITAAEKCIFKSKLLSLWESGDAEDLLELKERA